MRVPGRIRQAMLGKLLTAALACSGCLAMADGRMPERAVTGTAIISAHDPALRIGLPPSAQYAGAARWDLYGMADCELHVFVDADAHKNVQRLYWVQFESYLPTRPELHHTYDSPQHATLGGLDFYVDTWAQARDSKTEAGGDGEHVRALIRGKGYTRPADMMVVRLVHLLDAAKRKELMLIYAEDLAPTGLTAADLNEGGKAHAQWAAIQAGLVERARQAMGVEPR
jgi:hypothetical protein